MNPIFISLIILSYFAMLLIIGYITAGKADNDSFFNASKQSPWYLVAFGMIGTSISGVTFVSVPGEVGTSGFGYFQFVLGNFLGYLVVVYVLLPMYYKLNLSSIYQYLGERFGKSTQKTGSMFFIISRVIGSAARLYLVIVVFQHFIFQGWGVSFELTTIICIGLILAYSIRGGIKTIVITDTLQTVFLVGSLLICFKFLASELDTDIIGAIGKVQDSKYSKVFFGDWKEKSFFWKQFISGIFMTIAMVGLDQDLMQKSLTCKTLKDSQKNMLVFSLIFMVVVLLFLLLGGLLYLYATKNHIIIPEKSDELFPMLAVEYFTPLIGVLFILGLSAAAFASADSALTALTTSFCIDILSLHEKQDSKKSTQVRYRTHLGFGVLIILIILLFYYFNDQAIISTIFKIAGYTYGPLLGLFSFGFFSKRVMSERFIPWVCLLAPVLTFGIEYFINSSNFGYKIGFELLLINAGLVCLFLWLLSHKEKEELLVI